MKRSGPFSEPMGSENWKVDVFLRSSKRHLPKGRSWILLEFHLNFWNFTRILLEFHWNFTRISLEFPFSTGALWKGALWALPMTSSPSRKSALSLAIPPTDQLQGSLGPEVGPFSRESGECPRECLWKPGVFEGVSRQCPGSVWDTLSDTQGTLLGNFSRLQGPETLLWTSRTLGPEPWKP